MVNSDITQYVELRPEDERFLRLLEVLGEFYEKGKILIFVDKQEKCDNLFRWVRGVRDTAQGKAVCRGLQALHTPPPCLNCTQAFLIGLEQAVRV